MWNSIKKPIISLILFISSLFAILSIPLTISRIDSCIFYIKHITQLDDIIKSQLEYEIKEEQKNDSIRYKASLTKEFLSEASDLLSPILLKTTKIGDTNYICLAYNDRIGTSIYDDDIVSHNEYRVYNLIKTLKEFNLIKSDEIYSVVFYNITYSSLAPKLVLNYKGSTLNNLENYNFVRTTTFGHAYDISISKGFKSALTSGTYTASTYRYLTHKKEFSSSEWEIRR